MGILRRHIEAGEGAWAVRFSGSRDIPLMLMRFQTQAHVVLLGTEDPDGRSHHGSDVRQAAQKGVAGTDDGLLFSDSFREPSTPLCVHAQHGGCFLLLPLGQAIGSLFLAL